MISVDKDVPIPLKGAVQCGRPRKYPVHTMEVGESFFVGERKASAAKAAASRLAKTSDKVFESHAVPGGLRVWRTK